MQPEQQPPDMPSGIVNTSSDSPPSAKSVRRKTLMSLATLAGLCLLFLCIILWMTQWRDQTVTTRSNSNTPPSTNSPLLKTEVVLSGRAHIWEIGFLPGGEMIFTERKGTLGLWKQGTLSELPQIEDVKAVGEGGLMGLAVDPDFVRNRQIFMCYNSTADDIRIVRWRLADNLAELEDRRDIMTGIPTNAGAEPGRHSGCRLGFGPDGYLWIGTGDTAQGDTSVQPKSLGGKVLRIDQEGNAAPGNLGGEYDARIFSVGHRNIQGLAFFAGEKNGILGLSVEHGPGQDDEVNELKKGHFGWAPLPGDYNEAVPMTDLERFPDAIPAIWASGSPAQAPSGAAIIKGETWQGWNGAVAIAFLKTEHLKILRLDAANRVTKEERVLSSEFGRLRAVAQGPDDNLYVSTSNGSNDKIIRLSPRAD